MKLEYLPVTQKGVRHKGMLTITAESQAEREQLQDFAKELQEKGMRHTRLDTNMGKETEYIKLIATDAMRG